MSSPAPKRSKTAQFKDFFRNVLSKSSAHRRASQAGRKRALSVRGDLCNGVLTSDTQIKPKTFETLANGGRSEPTQLTVTAHPKLTNERAYWGPTKELHAADLEALLKRQLRDELNVQFGDPGFRLMEALSGSFNTAYILESSSGDKVCIRVPACGWSDRWNEVDAETLRATTLGMKFIKDWTGLPIPELLSYDTTLDNEIRAPYVMMSYVDGANLERLWEGETDHTRQVEEKRQVVLRNLAALMPKLQSTQFDRAGELSFPNSDESKPTVDTIWHLTSSDIFTLKREFVPVASAKSVAELLLSGREERSKEVAHSMYIRKGVFMLWTMMIEAFLEVASVAPGEPEFVLMQSDFNPANIHANEHGEIVGLIDWDCLKAVPRQIGWCSIPHMLQRDWKDNWKWPAPEGTKRYLPPDEYSRYRRDYARYLQEACDGKGDCRFTSKSHIYQALFDSAINFTKVETFVMNVMTDILPRNSRWFQKDFKRLGKLGWYQWDNEKEWLKTAFLEYFRPEL